MKATYLIDWDMSISVHLAYCSTEWSAGLFNMDALFFPKKGARFRFRNSLSDIYRSGRGITRAMHLAMDLCLGPVTWTKQGHRQNSGQFNLSPE